MEAISYRDLDRLGPDAEGGWAVGGFLFCDLSGGEIVAGPWIVPGGSANQFTVWGGGSLSDLAATAPAAVGEASSLQISERISVDVQPIRLADNVAVPVESECFKISHL